MATVYVVVNPYPALSIALSLRVLFMNIRALTAAAGLALASVSSAVVAAADAYPSRPISLVVPFSPGGSTDVNSRVVAQYLGQELGESVVVENRAGASTIIGASYVARSKADGYTIFATSGTTLTANPAIRENLPYDPLKDFEPIALIGRCGLVLLAHPDAEANDVASFVEYAKANPGTPYGSFGSGSTAHFVGAEFSDVAGIELTHVPYKGSSPAMSDLIGGQIQYSVDTVVAALPQIKDGNVKALAVSSPQRSTFLPDVPLFAEQGYPQVGMDTWLMIVAPRGLPTDVKTKLENALQRVTANPKVIESMAAQGLEVDYKNGADSEALIRQELPLMKSIAQRANIRAD